VISVGPVQPLIEPVELVPPAQLWMVPAGLATERDVRVAA